MANAVGDMVVQLDLISEVRLEAADNIVKAFLTIGLWYSLNLGHLKADFTEKALTILKHSEQLSRVLREDMPKRIFSIIQNYIVFGVSLRILQTLFVIQVPNAMLTCYSKKGLWEKARGICEKDCREWELGAYSFDLLATGYSVGGLMVKAAERIKKAISCLKGQRDVELSEELSKPVMENCHFEPAIYDRLKTRIEYGNL
ncbi:hypothetical protein NC652_030559 [Populus alba x Populus x berolinensis]|nr:hypothetical protein NC652_030559 [Populus alba x Populus x berolinensis]